MALIKMTDSALDSSNEALLARIAKLEHALLVGGVPARAETAPSKKADKPATPPEVQKKSEPKAPVRTSAPTQTKAIRGWSEIAEAAAMGDRAVLPFLKMGKAFDGADGKVSVKFPNDFAKTMVERASISDNIRVALAKSLGRDIAADSFELGIITREEDALSDLDDLIV